MAQGGMTCLSQSATCTSNPLSARDGIAVTPQEAPVGSKGASRCERCIHSANWLISEAIELVFFELFTCSLRLPKMPRAAAQD